MPDKQPWERQKGETHKAFEAFSCYRDMGSNRSQAKVAQELGKSETLMSRWSTKWNWVERAVAWDENLDTYRRKEHMSAIAKMTRKHAEISEAGLAAVAQIVAEFIRRVREGNLKALGTNQLNSLFLNALSRIDSLTKVERGARGLPELWLMIGQMTDEQLTAYVTTLIAEGQATGFGIDLGGDETQGLADALLDLAEDSEGPVGDLETP